MLPNTSESYLIEDLVHERALPIYPTNSPAIVTRPSGATHVSGVTTRVSDYGRSVRQTNEAGETVVADANLFAGLDSSSDAESLNRPDVISDEDLEDPRLSIKSRLNSALQQDLRNNEKRFLPSGDLKRICNHSAVREDLIVEHGYHRDDAESYAKYVCGKPAQEIYSILALINYTHLLPVFLEAGLVDVNLPFTWNEGRTELLFRGGEHKEKVGFFNNRKHAEVMREFYNKQWWIHVPFLDWDKKNHKKALNFRFDEGTVLPWTEIGTRDKTGGFGVVEKVHIHKDHHSFEHEAFALKTMITTGSGDEDYRAFQQEIAAFRKMEPGPHLVKLCATLEVTPGHNSMLLDKFMLLFPWAEGGNLKGLMERSKVDVIRDHSLTESEFVRWIAEQCRGLVEALGAVHTVHRAHSKEARDNEEGVSTKRDTNFGIHGDIKPANILHFSQETDRYKLGVLKLADFGLMTFHTRASRTRMNRDFAFAAFQTYRSPEHDICYYMSKKVDVWALGCVFSQLMTWVILDNSACEKYQEARLNELSHSGVTKDKGNWKEDHFFVKHVQKEKLQKKKEHGKSERSVAGRRSPSNQPRRSDAFLRRGQKVKAGISRITRQLQYLLLAPERFEEVPRLKVCVIEWIDNLIREASHKEGPTFLTDFLPFIRDEMLNPDRVSRTDCRNALEFLDDTISQGSDINWYFDL